MIWLCFLLLGQIRASTIYEIVRSGLCSDNPSGSKIVDKTKCQEQASTLGFVDTTATTIAMSGTVPGGCVFIQSKGELRVYDSDNINQCSNEFECICEYTAPECQAVNENDCICGETICTRQTGLKCDSGTCSHASACPNNERVCRCGNFDCTPASGLVCESNQCSHAPECLNNLGLMANAGMCHCGDFDCQKPYCVAASNTCRDACPVGTFVTNQNVCQDCLVAGYYCPAGATQSETTFACPAGKYSKTPGIYSEEQCILCPIGKFSNVPATIEDCNICGANTYQDTTGQVKCKGCPDEKVIHDATSAEKHDSEDDCQINVPTCLPTEYLTLNNTCRSCTLGHMCDGNSKEICQSGHYCTGDGSATECPVGRYGETQGMYNEDTACLFCAEGTFQTVPGQTYCARSCPLGKFGNVRGGTSETEACFECPVGHMCGTMAMQQSVVCPLGTYQDELGYNSCKQCAQGMYSDVLGNSECQPCGQDELGRDKQTAGLGSNSESQCTILEKTCPGAQRPNTEGTCVNCPQGFYTNGLGTRCRICQIGKKQPMTGQYSCLECQNCLNVGHDVAKTLSFNASDYVRVIREPEPPKSLNWVNIIIYGSLLGTVVIIVLSHRACPECIKHLDFVFAGDHLVEDTHARRMLNTRLGAAFTLCIPFIVAAISVFVFTDENLTEQSALVPDGTISFNEDVNHVYMEYKSWYMNGQQNCQDISVDTDCDFQISDGLPCHLNITCPIQGDFSGTRTIDITLPDNHQRATIKVWPDMWMRQQTEIYKTLETSSGLVGTQDQPTAFTFGIKKCKYINSVVATEQNGVKINAKDTIKQESTRGTINGHHVVRLQFTTSENVFLFKVDAKLTLLTQLSTILTLLISVLSSLRTIKLLLEKTIDQLYTCCCKNVPLDIQRRQNILNEIDLTRRSSKIEQKVPLEIHLDEVTGKRYSYCQQTKKSKWIL